MKQFHAGTISFLYRSAEESVQLLMDDMQAYKTTRSVEEDGVKWNFWHFEHHMLSAM